MWTIIPSDRRRSVVVAVAIALALCPSLAFAQEAPSSSPPSPSAPDPLGPLRERFKEGMDRYRAGAYGDAAVIWEAIYRELGPDTGYRLAFNLGRAYDQLGDLIKAAEHYETYLATVKSKRDAGMTLEANVEKQEVEAKERLDAIAAAKGRIRVKAGATPVVARIDNAPPRVSGFVVYVEPGAHVVRFAGEKEDVREIVVRPGQIVEVEPKAPEPKPVVPPPPPPPPQLETRIEKPFSPIVLWVSAGVTLASFAIPIITYSGALSIKSDYEDPSKTDAERARLETDYESARSNAYATTAVPSILAATTVGLTIWYLLGDREVKVPVTPGANVSATGASFGASGRF